MMKNEYFNDMNKQMEENRKIINICNSIKILVTKEIIEIKESIIENMIKQKSFTIKTDKGVIEWNICKIDDTIKLTIDPITDINNNEYTAILKLNDDSYSELVERIKEAILYNNYIVYIDNGVQINIQTKEDLSNICLPNIREIEAYSFPQLQLSFSQNSMIYPPMPMDNIKYKIRIAPNTIKAIMYLDEE